MSRPTQYRSFWGWPFQAKLHDAHTHNNETESLTCIEGLSFMKHRTQKTT